MVNKITVLGLVVLLTLFLVGCNSNDETIKIGFSYELTGQNSELGRDAMYGALQAVNEINENGGVNRSQLELIIKDDLGSPETGVEVDNQLITEGCVAIIGHGTSNMADLTIENANENDFILLSPTISTYEVEGIDDNFFRMIPSNRTQGTSIGEFIDSHTPGDVIIFTELINSAFTESVSQSLSDFLDTTSNNYLTGTFTSRVNDDYNSVAESINESDALNVVLIGSSYDVSSIIQKDLRDDIHVYIPVWATTSGIFDLSGDNINNTHGLNYYDITSYNPKYVKFTADYIESYGLNPSFSSMFSYESVYTLSEAIENAKSLDSADIKASLLNLPSQNWLIDDVELNQYGDIVRKVYWFHLIDNEFVEVQK